MSKADADDRVAEVALDRTAVPSPMSAMFVTYFLVCVAFDGNPAFRLLAYAKIM